MVCLLVIVDGFGWFFCRFVGFHIKVVTSPQHLVSSDKVLNQYLARCTTIFFPVHLSPWLRKGSARVSAIFVTSPSEKGIQAETFQNRTSVPWFFWEVKRIDEMPSNKDTYMHNRSKIKTIKI